MLKGNRKYVFFLIICFTVLIVLQVITPKEIDWSLSYLKKDKIPYGTAALYETLPFLFPGKQILVKEVPLYNALNDMPFKHTAYAIINEQFEADKLDVHELAAFVKAGNTAFISANYFSKSFSDTLNFKTDIIFNAPVAIRKDSAGKQKYELQRTTGLNFYNPSIRSDKAYEFEILENCYFSKFDTTHTTVLGNIKGKINFIRIDYGNGSFYLHSTPEAFTNFNFLKQRNAEYAEKVFAHLNPDQFIWDDYYKTGRVRDDNPLHVIVSHAPLATAYYVSLISLLAFIVIGIKRKQRIIPVIEPVSNTTLDFVNTIGTLYYQQGSHKEIAEKQINYFMASLRSMFRLTATDFDEAFITRLSNLSGINRDKIKGLMSYISYMKSKSEVYEQELLQLNKMLEDFYKLNKR